MIISTRYQNHTKICNTKFEISMNNCLNKITVIKIHYIKMDYNLQYYQNVNDFIFSKDF